MTDLLNVDKALEQILTGLSHLEEEIISINDALGRVLAKDITAAIDLPPFANSSMDGYALRASDITGATGDTPVQLRVTMDIPAGIAPQKTLRGGEAARIMTGAPMPEGADAVIPVEETDSDWSKGEMPPLRENILVYGQVQPGDYVRAKGENIRQGEIVMHSGTTLRAQEIGMLAALGEATLPVIRQPRVAIISSGDELVAADEALTPGKIRDVNSYTLSALVKTNGGIPLTLPVARDDLNAVHQIFRDALAQKPDIILSSAGVSVGTADLIRTVLDEMGEVNFWRINLRPGKPLAFGQIKGVPFFGLPGNPVSAMVTFEVIVCPALYKLAGRYYLPEMIEAFTGEDMHSDGRRSYIRVQLRSEDNRIIAHTTGTQSSGALMSMVLADGLLIIPEGVQFVPAGTLLQVQMLKTI